MAGSYGTGSIRAGLNYLQQGIDAANQAAGNVQQTVQSNLPGTSQGQETGNSYLKRLADALAPERRYTPIPFISVASGSLISNQNNNAFNGNSYNSIIGTVIGTGAQVNVYLNQADPNTQAPDFVFVSGINTQQLFFPSMGIETVTLYSAGSNPATGKVIFLQY